MSDEAAKVYIHHDWMALRLGVRVVSRGRYRDFGTDEWKPITEGPTTVEPLWFSEDEARALYEALADHYGHSGNDVRALRRDYDAERDRVDLLIKHVTGSAR